MKCAWQWAMVGGYLGILGLSSNANALPFRLQPPPQSYYYGGGMWVDGSFCTARACSGFAQPVATCPLPGAVGYPAPAGGVAPAVGVTGIPLNTGGGPTIQSATKNQSVGPPLAPDGSSQISTTMPSDPRMDALMERLNRIEELLILHEKYLQEQREQRLK